MPTRHTTADSDLDLLVVWIKSHADGSHHTRRAYERIGRQFVEALARSGSDLRRATIEHVQAALEVMRRSRTARLPEAYTLPAGPPLEKLNNGPPGTRRTPVNTALAWIRGTRTSTRGIRVLRNDGDSRARRTRVHDPATSAVFFTSVEIERHKVSSTVNAAERGPSRHTVHRGWDASIWIRVASRGQANEHLDYGRAIKAFGHAA